MSVSVHKGHFFQTSTSLAEDDRRTRKAANIFGNPIKFASKILAICSTPYLDRSGNTILVAEAGGTVSVVNVASGESKRVGHGSQAPLTSLVTYGGKLSPDDSIEKQLVFAGGWDKSISCTEIRSSTEGLVDTVGQTSFPAHADFVKCLVVAQTPDKQLVLISGGADGDINIWTLKGQRLAKIKPQSRGIEHIALDPFSEPGAPRVFFATSQREIYSFLLPKTDNISKISLSDPIVQHETSVYKIHFDDDGDMWTCSADKTAKRLLRENSFTADTTLHHPDFVRDVVTYDQSALVLTACRDEEIRVWQAGTSQLLHVFTGHFEEVTGLVLCNSTLVSVSIDTTVRRWSIAPQDLLQAVADSKNPRVHEELSEPKNDLGGLTEEEEAELRALMEEEEADTLERMVQGDQ